MAEKAGKDTGVQIGTPYDDVFRTLLNDCRPLVIQLINEVFGENYTGEEEVVFSPNEHFLNQQDGAEDKRITDTSFSIIGTKVGKSLLECQTNPDSSMLIRIFEYSTQVALDEGKISCDTLEVEIPNCAILFLRNTKNTPEQMHIRFQFREEYFTYDIPVIKIQRYTLDDLLRKNLLFLLPFYIFIYSVHKICICLIFPGYAGLLIVYPHSDPCCSLECIHILLTQILLPTMELPMPFCFMV